MKAASQSIRRVELKCRAGNWRIQGVPLAGPERALSFLAALRCSDGKTGFEETVERRLHPTSRITGAVPWPLTPVRNVLEEPAATSFSFHSSVVPVSRSSHLPDTEAVPCSHPLFPLLFTYWAPGPTLAIETPTKRPKTDKEMEIHRWLR